MEDRVTPTVNLTGGFNGLNNTGWYPPDTNMAVGPNHVVEVVNETIGIYNKSTGALISSQTFPSFFSGFDAAGGAGMFDPSALYDEQAGRFVVELAVDDSSAHQSFIDIAVSNSSDPTTGWTKKQIEVDEGGQNWVDNGKIGMNADAYVFTGNAYTFSGFYAHEDVLIMNKSTLATTLTSRPSPEFSMIPARMHGTAPGGPMWFVETFYGPSSNIKVVRMDNVLSAAPTFTSYNVAVNPYQALNSAAQPGGTVETIDSRTLNVEWNGNNLVAGFDSSVGTDAAAAWVEFNTGGAVPVLAQQGVIHPGLGVQTYFPSVAVDGSGTIGMTYMQSSASQYVSMYVSGRLSSDPINTMEAPVLAKAGNTTLNPGRSGDYSGIGLDPSSPGTFWAGNEFALSGSLWGTWIASFRLAAPISGGTPPTVAAKAASSPNPVSGKTTGLSVLGADDTGESNLTYSWSASSLPAGAPSPTFSVNGSNGAKNTTATFYQAGTYTLQATITDPGLQSVTSSVSVTVNQTLTGISITPGNVTLAPSATQSFSASTVDQFGKAMASQPTFLWSDVKSGIVGTINSSGLYTALASGSDTVSATGGGKTGTATVAVTATPTAPSNVIATYVFSPRRIRLSWTDNSSNESGFTIQRAAAGSGWVQIAQVGANVTSFSDWGVRRGQTYQYRVSAFNSVGSSAWATSAVVNAYTSQRAPGNFPRPDAPEQISDSGEKEHGNPDHGPPEKSSELTAIVADGSTGDPIQSSKRASKDSDALSLDQGLLDQPL